MNIYDVKGRIFNIQKFSVHDGPGIRSIVFLKGCALRCQWCCNPESQSSEIGTMTMPDGRKKTVGRDVTVGQVMEEILKDRIYYRRSGAGGLTLSGGETLLQPDFAEALLRAAKENGLTTAIESTGFARFETIARLLPYLDTFLMDIKHMDPDKHKRFTTQSNALILENAPKIAANVPKLIIRVPTIPGFNDTKEEIGAIAAFAKTLPGVTEIHLLPYHRLGADKYTQLGREYLLRDLVPPTDAHMEELRRVAEATGLSCQIGG